MDDLLARCEKEGLLRAKPVLKDIKATQKDSSESFFKTLMDLLTDNDFEELYEQVKKVLQGVGESGKGILQSFIQLKGRHSDLKEQITLGLVRYEDHVVLMNQIRKGYIDQIDLLKSEWPKLNVKL